MAERNDESQVQKIPTKLVMDRVESLPTLPIVAIQVGELVSDPNASAADVARVMRGDPSLTAKVLQLVNSAYFSIPGGVTDVQRAISFVGFNTLHQLVLSVSVLQALETPKGSSFDARGLWIHSLGVATCARGIARKIGCREDSACFTAGLLHDIGKIALAIAVPERFCSAIDSVRSLDESSAMAERRVGLPSHSRVGSRLARKWRFPAALIAPIEHHHTNAPSLKRTLSRSLITSVDIVAAADNLVNCYEIGNSGSPGGGDPDLALLDRLGLSQQTERQVYSQLMRDLDNSKAFLRLIEGPVQRGESLSKNGSPAGECRGKTTVKRAPRPGSR